MIQFGRPYLSVKMQNLHARLNYQPQLKWRNMFGDKCSNKDSQRMLIHLQIVEKIIIRPLCREILAWAGLSYGSVHL